VHTADSVRNLIFVLFLAIVANAQSDLRNSITVSAGSALNGPRQCCQFDTSVALGATYDYRVIRYLQIEAGIMTAIHPTPHLGGATFDIDPTDRFLWVPFGLQGVLPLWGGRLEASAGGGGIYEHYYSGNIPPFVGKQSDSAWRGYFKLGTAVAIDRTRHFWLGASAREISGNRTRAQWVIVTGDLSFRF
jgi:hypothetical protein